MRTVAKVHHQTPIPTTLQPRAKGPKSEISATSTRASKLRRTWKPSAFSAGHCRAAPGRASPLGWVIGPWYTGTQHAPSYNKAETIVLLVSKMLVPVWFSPPLQHQVDQSCCLGAWGLGGLPGGTRPQRGGHKGRGIEGSGAQPHSDRSTVNPHTLVMWEDSRAKRESPVASHWRAPGQRLLWNRVEVTPWWAWHHGPED